MIIIQIVVQWLPMLYDNDIKYTHFSAFEINRVLGLNLQFDVLEK